MTAIFSMSFADSYRCYRRLNYCATFDDVLISRFASDQRSAAVTYNSSMKTDVECCWEEE